MYEKYIIYCDINLLYNLYENDNDVSFNLPDDKFRRWVRFWT